MNSKADTGVGAMASVGVVQSSPKQGAWSMGKIVASGLLALNALMQIGGGSMMTFAPAKAATDMFDMAPTADLNRVVAIIGGVTLGCFALSIAALVLIVRGRKEGSTFALAQGLMLMVVGLVMVATGTSLGVVDICKGIAMTLIAVWAARATSTNSGAA